MTRFLGFRHEEYFVHFFHCTALGAALIPLFYALFRRLSLPELSYVFFGVTSFIWLILILKNFKINRTNLFTSFTDISSALILLATVFMLLHVSHFTDVVFLDNGFNIRNIALTETDFHLGIVNNLKDMYPPLYPYASGLSFSHYHLNMHLQIELFHRLFSLNTLKLTFFFFPLMYFCLLVFMPYIFFSNYWNQKHLGVLAGLLLFGTGLSFVPGLMGLYPLDYSWIQYLDYPWTLFFRTTIWSLFSLNGGLPALFVMFLCIFYLKKYFDDGRLRYLCMFALLGVSAFGFKSSMGPHIIGASFLTAIASCLFMQDKKKGFQLMVLSTIALFFMVFDLLFLRGGTGNNIISLDLMNNFHHSLNNLRISGIPWFLYPVLFFCYVIATFGVRILGFYTLRDYARKKDVDPVVFFLIIMTITGFLLAEMVYIGSPVRIENNAAWFAIQSLMAAWILLAYYLMTLAFQGKRLTGLVLTIILLAAPTTVQYVFLRFDHNYYHVDDKALEVLSYLENTPPDSVILHPRIYGGISIAANLAGRPSVISLLHSHAVNALGRKEMRNRRMAVNLFFSTIDSVDRLRILRKYKVDYVYAPLIYDTVLDRVPGLRQVFGNSGYAVYEVTTAD